MGVVGILALQGDFSAHRAKFERLGVATKLIRRPCEIGSVDRLTIPGGESGVMLKLMAESEWEDAIESFHQRRRPIWGTCAGMILLAAGVSKPSQSSLGLIDIDVERNGFGRQIHSFESSGKLLDGSGETVPMVFIRAPRINRLGEKVETLAKWNDEPVLVQQANVLACSFHPELVEDDRVERMFLRM